jgi:hypothetical protein
MVILSFNPRNRLPSETRAAVCLIPGPEFVLWPEEDYGGNKKRQGDGVPLPTRPGNPCGAGPLPGTAGYFFSAGVFSGFTASSTFSAAFFVDFFTALPVAFTPFTDVAVPSEYFT